MKKIILNLSLILMMAVGLVSAGPVVTVPLIGGGDPIYTEEKFAPLVFLNQDGGRVLIDDIYGPFNNGDITLRNNNYAFEGEQIRFEVLVFDKNGVPEKIQDVFSGWTEQLNGPLDPEIQVNCDYQGIPQGCETRECLLDEMGFPNVRRPGDQQDEEYFDPNTMGIYSCLLTFETSNSCHGQKWIGVKVVDIDGLEGTMQESESWFCNPILDLYVSGSINLGTLGPGEVRSSTVSVENVAEQGSGVEIILGIAGTDFYDPSSSPAICPTTNKLALQGIPSDTSQPYQTGWWYTATMGTNQVGEKRIPYSSDGSIYDVDPIFSSGSGYTPTYSPLIPMTPGAETTINFFLGLPVPCNGEFTDGEIFLTALAV